ncbi:MAG: hypothetical protein U0414_14865 [Polyangiaceae bacterium]
MRRSIFSGGLVAVTILSGAACTNVVGGITNPGSGGGGDAPLGPVPQVQNVDLVLVVDNSASMADKQAVLSKSIHRLLDGLVNPPCVDGAAHVQHVAGPLDACPTGYHREFNPIQSVHLGIVSSSLGSLGAEQCQVDAAHQNNDHGHLVSRGPSGDLPTYLNYGFLNFDPPNLVGGETNFDSFIASAVDMVQGVGQVGCGYEMPLEAAYRFLVDPAPYAEIQHDDPNNPYSPTSLVGVDTTLLEQRANFLRADSLVGVVMLTDENDCSFKTGEQWYTLMNSSGFFKPTSICETDPSSTCCHSCALEGDPSCGMDSACDGTPKYNTQAGEDSVNLRCFHQKQKYGIDALFPTSRYVNAFTRAKIAPSADDLVPDTEHAGVDNPLFSSGRDPRLFVFAGIVGVPWQLIAVDPSDASKGSLTAEQLEAQGKWDQIVGDPANYVPPSHPNMIESIEKRPGVDPTSNGGDRTIDFLAPDDLQYACIFPLPTPLPNGPNCGAKSAPDSPLCDPAMHSTQVAAAAYPGLRELAVMRDLGDKAVVGSVCEPSTTIEEEVDEPNAATFGYNRTMTAMGNRIATLLVQGTPSQK